jgi:RHS repeat-associated protein
LRKSLKMNQFCITSRTGDPHDDLANSDLLATLTGPVHTVTTTYQYDAQSRRIAKIAGTTTTSAAVIYLYDAWNNIVEYTRSTGPTPTFTLHKTRLWGQDLSGSMQGAGGVGGLLLITVHSALITSHYPTYDGNGNVSEYLTTTGSVAAHYEYDPFGNTVVNTDTANFFTYKFSTKPADSETGLYYYGYRYYDPMTGRWPSRDPIEEEGGVSIYGFVFNNPLFSVDVLGMQAGLFLTPIELLIPEEVVVESMTPRFVPPNPVPENIIPFPKPTPTPSPYPPFVGPPAPDTNTDPNDSPDDKCKKCLPCDPEKGSVVWGVDRAPSPPHDGIPVPHSHKLTVNQSPPSKGCECFFKRESTPVPGVMKPEWPKGQKVGGGGIAP